ncbi:CCAT-binding transcription factor-like protein, putative [Plasmodium vinckei vinckei]|uniref:CCAT-binding transcription factor-like protein, putative n=1 Tax=Plasmodium vinckei vinckei TaxID=54757 RepID=A0A081ICC7_PLAVN|nr:CCAT-binding transcription factor-like protein, putative [Plasmodium vinckei vinckei]KEG01335.1 hypothetical protein YYE_03923 [Plasmodium vinckei vinckei]VEV55311.1 CCAT-binding transcription factor-like protein, putative [Plasmodium vinckei vinckei]
MKNNIIKISFAIFFLSYYVSEINGNVTNKNKFNLRSYFTKNEDLNNASDNENVHGESEEKIVTVTNQTTLSGTPSVQTSGDTPQARGVNSTDISLTQGNNTEQPCTECESECTENCTDCHDEDCTECHDEDCTDCHDETCTDCHDESCPDCQTECTDACREECAQMRAANNPNCEECKKILNPKNPETHGAEHERQTTPEVQIVIEDITNDTKSMPDEDEPVCDEQLDEGGDNEEEEDNVDIEDVEIIESTEEIEDSNDSEDLELELEGEEVTNVNTDGQEGNEGETEATVTNENGNSNTNTNEVANNNQTNNTNNANNSQTNNTNSTNNNNNGANLLIKEYKGNTNGTTENENILDNALSGIDDNQFSSDIQDFSQDITEYALMEDDI